MTKYFYRSPSLTVGHRTATGYFIKKGDSHYVNGISISMERKGVHKDTVLSTLITVLDEAKYDKVVDWMSKN